MKKVKIANKLVGEGQPTFIIAEAGVNHNGKIELAEKLVDIAAEAGADAVKFQTFKSEGVITAGVAPADYAKKNIGKNITELKRANKGRKKKRSKKQILAIALSTARKSKK